MHRCAPAVTRRSSPAATSSPPTESSAGWEACAMMVWYPDFFGGTWVWAPDPVDFHKYTQINIYEYTNAFYR